jgi:dolichyl-phosphate-mannose-protein mannosyltransferase
MLMTGFQRRGLPLNARALMSVVLISVYFILAIIKINYPGVHYDEIYFGNAAVGGIDDVFIRYKIGNFPILLMTYIGALKAYFYYPIFKVFGVSAYSIRIPTILVTAISLYVLYGATKRLFNDRVALLTLFLLSIDASFISQTRYDVGPTVIEFLLKTIVIYLFAWYLQSSRDKYLFWIYVMLSLGLFNKLNFIWFINSFYFAVLVVYRNIWPNLQEKGMMRSHTRGVVLLSYLPLAGYFLWMNYIYDLFQPLSFHDIISRWSGVFSNVKDLVTGVSFYNYALGNMHSLWNDLFFLMIAAILAAGLIFNVLLKKNPQPNKKNYFLFVLVIVTTIPQILITKEAKNIWHVFTLYPCIPIIMSVSLIALYDLLSKKAFAKFAVIALIALITAHQLIIDYKYIQAYKEPTKNIYWSMKIYDLIKYTRNDPHRFASIDWAIHTQLTTFTCLRDKYKELSYAFRDMTFTEDNKRWLVSEYLDPRKNYYFIAHSEVNTYFHKARNNLFTLADENNIQMKLIKTISDEDGKVIFEIYAPESITIARSGGSQTHLRK